MSLLGEVAPLIAPLLGEQALFRLTSSSNELRALQGLPLDLASRCACASEALRVARVHHTRFLIPAFTVDRCSQAEWEQLCTLPGLVSLTVKGSRRNPTVGQTPPGPVSALSGSALLSLPQSRSIVSLRLLEHAGALVHDLSHAALCVALETLVLHRCAALTDVAPLAAAPRLRCLELRKATALTDLAPLCCGAACWRLASLGLQGCRLLRDVASLGALRALEELDVSSCVGLEDLSPLGSCGQLRLLRATGCTKLRCVDGLARCKALRTAYFTGCASLQDVAPLAECAALHTLHLGRCSAARDVSALGRCPSLCVLNLRCSGAVVVPLREGLLVEFDVGTTSRYEE